MSRLPSIWRLAFALATWGGSVSLAAAQQLPVPSAGVVPDVPGATDKPDPARTYRFVFDMQSVADSADAISPAVTGVARLINTYRAYGVPADHIEATAVFHGRTIVLVTKDETYRNRTGAKANPNAAMLRQLAAAGVKMVVCGVSAREQNYTAADLLPVAHLNLSATITFFDLQTRGFVKVER
jgi:intracellular sulfur oxidation DsrE/DsrF family protein